MPHAPTPTVVAEYQRVLRTKAGAFSQRVREWGGGVTAVAIFAGHQLTPRSTRVHILQALFHYLYCVFLGKITESSPVSFLSLLFPFLCHPWPCQNGAGLSLPATFGDRSKKGFVLPGTRMLHHDASSRCFIRAPADGTWLG